MTATKTVAATAPATAPAPIIRCQYVRDIPTTDPFYSVPPDFLAGLIGCAETGTPVCLIGAAGTGKTEAAREVAARLGRPFVKVDASAVTFASDWYGNPTATEGGRIGWQDSILVSALADPTAVILIDELNRADSRALNGLLGLLDRTAMVQFPQRAEPIRRAQGVAIFASANVGIEYSGTGALCRALSDRFQMYETDYLTVAEEASLLRSRVGCSATASLEWAKLAAQTRMASWIDLGGMPISTRALIDAARLAEVYASRGNPRNIALRALLTRQPRETYGGAAGSKSPRERLSAWVTANTPNLL